MPKHKTLSLKVLTIALLDRNYLFHACLMTIHAVHSLHGGTNLRNHPILVVLGFLSTQYRYSEIQSLLSLVSPSLNFVPIPTPNLLITRMVVLQVE